MRPSRTRCRRALLVLCCVAIAAPLPAAAQGSSITNGDLPGAESFSPGSQTVLLEDWSGARNGFLPATIALVEGSMSVVEERGRRFLRVNESGSFDVVLPAILPEEYTIEFDMLVPSGTGYAVEIRPALPGEPAGYAGLSRRARNPVVHCGAIGAGVYGASLDATRRFDNAMARSLVPCQIAVSAQGVRVFFAGEDAATVPNVTLGRTPRLRFHVPAMAGQEALIGPIRIATTGVSPAAPAVGTVAQGGVTPQSAPTPMPTQPAPTPMPMQPAPTPMPMQPAPQPMPAQPAPEAVPAQSPQPAAPPTAAAPRTPGTTVTPKGGAPTNASGSGGPGVMPGRGQPVVGGVGNATITRTPQAAAASLRAQGKTVGEAATALAAEFNASLEELVASLAAGGFGPGGIAAWLREDEGASVEAAMILMGKAKALTPEEVVAGVWSAFVTNAPGGATADVLVAAARKELHAAAADVLAALTDLDTRSPHDWATLLARNGYAAYETAEALRIVMKADEHGVYIALHGTAPLADLALALLSSFNTDAERFAELTGLTVPGRGTASPADVLKALRNVYKLAEPAAISAMTHAGFPGASIVKALKEAYTLTPAQIIARLQGSVPGPELVGAVLQQFPGTNDVLIAQAFATAGANANEIALALRGAIGPDAPRIATALVTGGKFDPTVVAHALTSAIENVKPETVALALAAAGVPPGPIATALIDAFQLAATTVASLLATVGIQ